MKSDDVSSPISDHNRMKRPALPAGAFRALVKRASIEKRLKGHIDSAHAGKIDPSCNACKELSKPTQP